MTTATRGLGARSFGLRNGGSRARGLTGRSGLEARSRDRRSEGEVAGRRVLWVAADGQGRVLPLADRLRDGAPGAEPAAARNAQRARRVAADAGASPTAVNVIRGMAASRPCVYGWRGLANSVSVGATSMIRPRYMTATRSHRCRTTARLCEISSSVSPSSARRSWSRFRIVPAR